MTAEARSNPGTSGPGEVPGYGHVPPGKHRLGEPASRGRRAPTPTNADLARRGLVVTDLVTRARKADQQAWDALVERYAPLIWSICRRHRLDDADAADVSQTVWLQLVDHLDTIHDPAALPGWLTTVTRRECLHIPGATWRPPAGGNVIDAETIPDEQDATAEQELLAAERHAALREALGDLPPSGQQLILLLLQDPPLSYADISAHLGVPVGSIGPTRRRCLDKLRRHPAIAALIDIGDCAA